MKRDVKKRLRRAVENFNNLYITKTEAVNILTIYGGKKETAEAIYGKMEDEWMTHLRTNNLVNPGIKGVPHSIAEKYFRQYGITEKDLRRNLDTLEKAEAREEK